MKKRILYSYVQIIEYFARVLIFILLAKYLWDVNESTFFLIFGIIILMLWAINPLIRNTFLEESK